MPDTVLFTGLFQSTPPRGRRLHRVPLRFHILNFNPRLREGGDCCFRRVSSEFCFISIHASAREATAVRWCLSPMLPYFNPRLREGGDFLLALDVRSSVQISIHASAREATNGKQILRRASNEFQSTPPRGRRRSTRQNATC